VGCRRCECAGVERVGHTPRRTGRSGAGLTRRCMKRWRMLTRILLRSLLLRPARTFTALGAVSVAAAVITAMLTLYVDVQAKLHQEFRAYGANVVVSARAGQSLPTDALARVDSTLGREGLAAPFAYAIARGDDDKPTVVVGADWQRVRRLNA